MNAAGSVVDSAWMRTAMIMNEQDQIINNDYKEIADCKGIELNGFFVVNDDNTVEWVDLS